MKILMYHEITDDKPTDVHSVAARSFATQLDWLFQHGYRTYSLMDYLTLSGAGRLPSKGVVLTFDDGYEDNYTTALPMLVSYGFTATIFLVSGLVGQNSVWRSDSPIPARLMSWGQAQEMLKLGMQFGSHTTSHPNLAALGDLELQYELVTSRHQIQEKLGVLINTMAYPYSQVTPRVKHFARQAGYEVGCTYQPRYVGNCGSDALQLRRIGILATDTADSFARKMRTDLRMRIDWQLRRWRNNVESLGLVKHGTRSLRE